MKYATHVANPDVLLVGSGIMSANLAVLLKRLDPKLTIQVYEVTDELAQESSHGWNNAGTGHAGICELSYTPKREADGSERAAHAFARLTDRFVGETYNVEDNPPRHNLYLNIDGFRIDAFKGDG